MALSVDRLGSARGAAPLDELERHLDKMPFRAAASLLARWQGRTQNAKQPRLPLLPSLTQTGSANPETLWQALASALAVGALESAEGLATELASRAKALTNATADNVTLLLETWLMLGQRERARELAENKARLLGATSTGLGVLELCGLDSGRDWLPDGRPHLLRLSRRVERGELTAPDLARLLRGEPRAWLRCPELHLLFVGALTDGEPARATRFLNRFLRLYGYPACDGISGTDPNVLARLHFSPVVAKREPRKLVSIIVAAHDAAATVGYAIASLLHQSYENLEILVGDDASTDGTLELLRTRFGAEPRVKLFRSSRNQGAYNLRNALAARARGELLTFHDADDFAFPDRIANQVRQLERPLVNACVGNFVRIRRNGSFVFFKDQKASRMCTVSLMLTRRAFDQVGPFRSARFGADLELFVALRQRLSAGELTRVRIPLLLGLASSGSATQASGSEALADGYRSPARRAYSELVFRQQQPGNARLSSEELDARLRATDNYQPPSELSDA